MAKEVLEMEVKSNIGEVTKDTKELTNEASNAAGEFTVMGVSLNGVKKGFASAAVTAKGMFGSIKAGLISTGFGAFLVLVGSLVSYFTNTKKGAEMLERAMSGLGAVVKVLTNLFSSVGETMVNAFNNPKQAIEDLWEGIKTNLMNRLEGLVSGFQAVGKIIKGVFTMDWEAVAEGAKEYGQAIIQISTGYDTQSQKEFLDNINSINEALGKAYSAEVERTAALQKLTDAQRDLNVETAQSIAFIEKQKLVAEDITKSYAEREKAATKAFAREKELETERISLSEDAVRLEKERHKLLGKDGVMAEDLDRLADLEITLANVRQESAGRQISLQNFLNGLRQTEAAEIEAQRVKEQEDEDAAFDKKIEDNNKWNEEQQKSRALNIAADKKAADEKKKIENAKMSMQVDMANQGLQILASAAGEGTALAKAAAIAQATISGVQGVQNAFTSANANIGATAGTFGAYPVTMAALAGTFAAMNIAKIASGGGGGVTPPSTPTPSIQTPSPQMMSGAFDISGGVAPEDLRAIRKRSKRL